MIKAVLLDLDDTLLGNPTQRFLERYLGLLDRYLRETLGIEGIIGGLMAGTRAVIYEDDPLRTNLQRFYDTLGPTLTVSREAFDAAVAQFYRDAYPQLQAQAQKRPGARHLVMRLIEQGCHVVVATNPLFPMVAIRQRLAWAGLPPEDIPFDLVTALDNMRYAKPHLAYYEEVLGRLGVQADEAIMVGDDWDNDIAPAWSAGLNTFWIVAEGIIPDAAQPCQPDGYGSLADFACRVQDENWLDTLAPRPHEPHQIQPRLGGNLAALLDMVTSIPERVWPMRPDPDEWSPIEVLCHLVESEREVQRPRLRMILTEDNPFLSQPKAPPAPASRVCAENAWDLALAFAAERRQTLSFIAGLDEDAWMRPARHYIFGPTTLLEMANFTAQHDRLHMTQLCQTVGKCL